MPYLKRNLRQVCAQRKKAATTPPPAKLITIVPDPLALYDKDQMATTTTYDLFLLVDHFC